MIPFGIHTHGRHFEKKVKYVFDLSTHMYPLSEEFRTIRFISGWYISGVHF